MFKFKKRIAVLLAATMVMGSTVTVFAEGVPGTQTLNATGASEGHVERKIANVVLPTVSGAAFNYTIDPERLVKETDAAKYSEDTDFTTDAINKGVFFLVSENKYDNKTAAEDKFKFTNKSTFPIDVTVEVKAKDTTAATDIALVSKNAIASATDASLYLGLKVGSEDFVPVLKDAPASITVSVNAVKSNFKTKVVSENDVLVYKYDEKPESDLTDWLTTSFQIEGETTDGNEGAGPQITDDTTTPALEITWKWAENGVAAATELTGSYDGSSTYRVVLAAAISDLSAMSNVKVNGVSLTSGYSLNNTKDNVKFDKAVVKSTLNAVSAWADATELTYTFTIDGVDYTCTISKS